MNIQKPLVFMEISGIADTSRKRENKMKLLKREAKFDIMVGEYIPEEFKTWLKEKGFFTAPASRNHHGNYEGGLFDHSLAVANELFEITINLEIKWEKERSPFIVGMFHDLCKIENYEKSEDGKYHYNGQQILTGHGEKSIMLLSQFMTLTEEEIYCIRFHMGPYDEATKDLYSKAIGKYETVLWTHTADMYASQAKGI